ncbi:MAG: YihY/virulence factor BrkB family protein [Deltaproteobacteria bacterium]|nr:YihY/virulence factor BrkB family protein [Deltaproteobacteria bacterium]
MAPDTVESKPLTEAIGGRPRSEMEVPPGDGHVVVRFFKQLGRDVWNDSIDDIGAMMTYYAILALFPMMVFVVTLSLLVLDHGTIQQGVVMATNAMPGSTRVMISEYVQKLVDTANPGFAIGSAAVALWGASRGAVALSGALNSIFGKTETRSWIRRQLTAIALTIGVALGIVLALGLLVVGPVAGHWIADRAGLGEAFDVGWNIARWVGAGLLVMMVWGVLYKVLPNTDAPFRVFTPGAFVGVLLWLGVGYLFGLYLGHWNSYETTYGALGTGIIFLTWLWLSNIALLLGAEINDVLADMRKHKSPAAARLADRNELPKP